VTRQNYRVLCQWWAKTVCENFSNKLPNGQRVQFCVSQAAYGATDSDAGLSGYGDGVVEIQRQIDANRANLSSGYTGSVFFNTSSYLLLFKDLKESHFKYKALIPPMDWKSKTKLSAPTNITLVDTLLSWQHSTAERFTLYAYPRGMDFANAKNDPQYLKGVVYGYNIRLDGYGDLSQQTIAICSYDRYGVEHAAAFYEGNEVFIPKQVIFWELNGGTIDVELPKYVTETYILPTPKKENNDFAGWFKTRTLRGTPLTEIPAGWKGTLYAKWKENTTALPSISLTSPMAVYNLMGHYVGDVLPIDQHGVFIVIQGENSFKIVL
jgi:uncharacterized repeat protein (TIGR02543 family)